MEARSEAQWEERPLRELSRLTAVDRGWAGLNAVLVGVAGGVSRRVLLARHNITMLVSPPLSTTAMCDEVAETRVQVPGAFDVLPAGSSVSWIDRGRSLFFGAGVEHELVRQTAMSMAIDPDRFRCTPQLTCRDPRIEHLLWALKIELETDEPNGRLYAESLGAALATQLVRRWASSTPTFVRGGLPKRKLTRVLAYIHERLSHDLSLTEIAEAAGISPSHFKVLFKQSLGVPVHRYVMRKRVERAAELLTRTDAELCDVALQAGFCNQSHMTWSMRRTIGVTPKALRDAP